MTPRRSKRPGSSAGPTVWLTASARPASGRFAATEGEWAALLGTSLHQWMPVCGWSPPALSAPEHRF
eukprot:13430021-Alexandrium_andersonii.AAC.1